MLRALIASALLVITIGCFSGDDDSSGTHADARRLDGAGGVDGSSISPDGAAGCTGMLAVIGPACAACVEASCCAELESCRSQAGCLDCLQAGGGGACAGEPFVTLIADVRTCEQTSCGTPCTSVQGDCNPVTNAGCDTFAGDACDYDGAGHFKCFGGQNGAAQCEACNDTHGPFCAPTKTCVVESSIGGACGRFCCTNADCGALYRVSYVTQCHWLVVVDGYA